MAEKEKHISLEFPEGFEAGKQVPDGGINCSNCAKWNEKKGVCEGEYYKKWNNGSGKITADPDEFVCVWWTPEEKSPFKKL